VSAFVGTRHPRAPRIASRVLSSLFAAVVAGGLGFVLVPLGLTLPWLVALCCVVFVLWLVIGLHRVVRSVGLVELRLDDEPRHLVLCGPWVTRPLALDEVAAIQVWCDCRAVKPVLEPHRDGIEVLLHNGSPVRVTPGTTLRPDVAVVLRELLEPLGVKVIDWGGLDAGRS
jgi:hypothetical protein